MIQIQCITDLHTENLFLSVAGTLTMTLFVLRDLRLWAESGVLKSALDPQAPFALTLAVIEHFLLPAGALLLFFTVLSEIS